MTHCKQGNFIIEFYETFHDNPPRSGASALLRIIPSLLNILCRFQHALSMTGRGHNRFHYARNSDFFHRTFEVVNVIHESIIGSRQAQLFCCQTTDAFSIHSEFGRFSGWDYVKALLFQFDQGIRCNCFNFRHDVIRLLFLHQCPQSIAIQHRNSVSTMRHLLSGGIFIAIYGDHFYA